MKKLNILLVIFSLIVCSCTKDDINGSSGKHEGHKYVDLGLSVKWATCNVGANSPEEYGDFFAFGETETKDTFTDKNYYYSRNHGYEDIGVNISGTQYDVAHVKWGGKWRIPTKAESKELIEKCTWTPTEINGVKGCNVTGPNGNSIFLPAAGTKSYTWHSGKGEYGYYTQSQIDLDVIEEGGTWALCFDLDDGRVYLDSDKRFGGNTIRPVAD